MPGWGGWKDAKTFSPEKHVDAVTEGFRTRVRFPPPPLLQHNTSTTYPPQNPNISRHLRSPLPKCSHTRATHPNTRMTHACTKSVSYVCHTSQRTSRPWCRRGAVYLARSKRGLSRWSKRSGSPEQRTPWQTMHTLSVPWDHAWRSVIDDRWQNANVCLPLPGKCPM